ncbi:hypothetical protein I551_5895 [Mycobacterium ulcerans str. Harvey]|uniref:Uncharacterized protein n=1 Tax=Mycobacterium ulcerans str. Harvey TaxID=1299332 RepID=A0ABP3AAI5_MYCUL|nr:hypothetical protein I551_5895 [Mycobacterium ulcerans str. Harvey]
MNHVIAQQESPREYLSDPAGGRELGEFGDQLIRIVSPC